MKRCPQCSRTYEDAKNFCLQDGTPLVADSAAPQFDAPPPSREPETPAPYQSAPAPQPQGPQGWSQAGSWQPPANLSGSPARKRRVWPWVLGVIGALVVGIVALVGFASYLVYDRVKEAQRRIEQAKGGPGKAGAAEGVKTFVNTREGQTGKLAEHYSDFSFQYPANWQLKESPGQSGSNFVKVERTEDGTSTLENFAVGWYTSTGTMEGDARIFPQLARQLSAQFATGFRNYRKVSEGRTRVARYDGYEFRFTAKLEGGRRAVDLFGRAVMLPSGDPAQRNGVALIMLATSLAPEIKSAADVGAEGELPVILNSFRLGADAEGASAQPGESSEAGETAEGAARGLLGGGDADAPADEGEVLEQLKQIEEEWARANIEGDKEALGRILAEEYTGTSSSGRVQRKAEYVRTIRPDPSLKSQDFEDLKVVRAGERAILSGVTVAHFADGREGRYRFVDTFVFRDGRWQATTSTATEIE